MFLESNFTEFLPVLYPGCPKHLKIKQLVDYELYALKLTRHKDSVVV